MPLTPADDAFAAALRPRLPEDTLRLAEPRHLEEPRGRWRGTSRWVALPRSTEEAATILRACNAARVGVVPYGGGTGLRDYLHMSDFLRAVERVCLRPPESGITRLNLGSGTGTALIDLIPRLEAARAALRVGDARDETTQIGPVISEAAAHRLAEMLEDAVRQGAVIVGGGGIQSRHVAPTLIDHVTPDMRLAREEAFGPVLSVLRVQSPLEALTVANDSDYGLAAAVFDRDPDRAEAFAADLHCGICHINGPTIDDHPGAPFGGTKMSGFGRFGGRWALDEFTETRWITRPERG